MRNRNRWRLDRASFVAGFMSSLLLLIILFGGAYFYVSTYGIMVQLDGEAMATQIREQVILQARQDLPKLITGAKSEIPKIVEAQMKEQLSDRMEIAGFVFTMPAELVQQLQLRMQANVENATGQILDGINTNTLAEQFGADVYQMVRQSLQGELNGQSFHVYLFERIPVLVRVQVK